jgi:hypothetical protein
MIWLEQGKPLLAQLKSHGLEFDQKLSRALEISASQPDIEPEDQGFPDSYLTLALYRLNTILTRLVDLDESRFNIFHEYKLAPKCDPTKVIPCGAGQDNRGRSFSSSDRGCDARLWRRARIRIQEPGPAQHFLHRDLDVGPWI